LESDATDHGAHIEDALTPPALQVACVKVWPSAPCPNTRLIVLLEGGLAPFSSNSITRLFAVSAT
jgi:hypothetical protein